MATENPIEQEGTFPLPEAQLDRFFLKTELGYPTADQEFEIVRGQREEHPHRPAAPVVTLDDVRELQHAIEDVYVDAVILRWIVELVQASRELDETIARRRPCARASRSSASPVPGRCSTGATSCSPPTSRRSSSPCSAHRIPFTPAFLAEARRLGRDEALAVFQRPVLRTRAASRARRGARAAASSARRA